MFRQFHSALNRYLTLIDIKMPYQMLCNDVQREGGEPSPDLASWLFCCSLLHNIWYGIQ
jgi:hypothetical protein